MRWDRLFDDLEARAEALAAAEFSAEIAERSRAEYGQLHLVDRLRAAQQQTIRLSVLGVGEVVGQLDRVGAGWVLLHEPPNREVLVSLSAVSTVGGLGVRTAVPAAPGPVAAATDLRRLLRAVARDRSAVSLALVDGVLLTGTLDRIGADFVELAEHPAGEPRRAGAVQSVRTVLLQAVALVRRS